MAEEPFEELMERLRGGAALDRKSRIGGWARPLADRARSRGDVLGPGDDAGAVRSGDGYLLLAAEGVWPPLLGDPSFAGFCAVTVNVNDVYAMGGRPLGLVTVVFGGAATARARDAFVGGVIKALDHYDLPMLGGHTSPDDVPFLVAACVAGRADRLLRGDGASPGDDILFAVDLQGEPHHPFHAWDTVTGADPSLTAAKLDALVQIAGAGSARACRDVSNPGLLGTLAMMLEASGAGAEVDLEEVPVPDGVDMAWWLQAYPSYGFLLAVPAGDPGGAASLFASRGIGCATIGRVVEGSALRVRMAGVQSEFIDWRKRPVTGLYP